MCRSKLAQPVVIEDHSEELALIRADIRELRERLAPFLALGPKEKK